VSIGSVDAVEHELRALQSAIEQHPEAASALLSALAAEGRSFSQTQQGAAVRQRLARSRAVQRLEPVMQALHLDQEAVPAGVFVDAVMRAAHSPDRESITRRLGEG
jgi:hypothetical protein